MKRDGHGEQVRQLRGAEALIREQVNCQMKDRDRQALGSLLFSILARILKSNKRGNIRIT